MGSDADNDPSEWAGGLDPEDLKAPAPSRDATRYPDRKRRFRLSDLRERLGATPVRLLVIAVVFISFVLQRIVEGEPTGDGSPAVERRTVTEPAPLPGDRALRAYLLRVQRICRDHYAAAGRQAAFDRVVRANAAMTGRIAAVPAPPVAAEVRRDLLRVRRALDRAWQRGYRITMRSGIEAYRRDVKPIVVERGWNEVEVFGSYGIDCGST